MTRRSLFHNQICAIIVVAIVLASNQQQCSCEPIRQRQQDMGAYMTLQQDMNMLGKLLAGANEERLYEVKTYEPNYFTRFPSLSELVQPNLDPIDDADIFENSRLLQRLRELTDNEIDSELPPRDGSYAMLVNDVADLADAGGNIMATAMPDAKQQSTQKANNKYGSVYKKHGVKKNIQYMTPCHFKICNMGRKRNARQFFGF